MAWVLHQSLLGGPRYTTPPWCAANASAISCALVQLCHLWSKRHHKNPLGVNSTSGAVQCLTHKYIVHFVPFSVLSYYFPLALRSYGRLANRLASHTLYFVFQNIPRWMSHFFLRISTFSEIFWRSFSEFSQLRCARVVLRCVVQLLPWM